jgi:hypothetical protein
MLDQVRRKDPPRCLPSLKTAENHLSQPELMSRSSGTCADGRHWSTDWTDATAPRWHRATGNEMSASDNEHRQPELSIVSNRPMNSSRTAKPLKANSADKFQTNRSIAVQLITSASVTFSRWRQYNSTEKGAAEGAERIFGVLKGAFECFSSPSMLMFSMSYKQLPLWHGRGHRFDPDQVHQLNQ